ncbi:hypothetical protein M427DRAFT_71724 [Gonapodya prolifera JEL478]|uniref:Uncharacterized protein n=1 Tax=Gonapodya prolifera (strain JEL478) TaxID=1344416 RepID=A0A139A997_GONPJ|nr:hypothetical protein M427DRAFT_71724 [Gonapodya prolifera JEL478]|eukprot:KXS12973.1 hypothetical protein M427DRAFT_71724 [Gonapodya prolifera JEL478]
MSPPLPLPSSPSTGSENGDSSPASRAKSSEDAVRAIGQYLLRGWVLTDAACADCGCPLMRSKDASLTFCPVCAPVPLSVSAWGPATSSSSSSGATSTLPVASSSANPPPSTSPRARRSPSPSELERQAALALQEAEAKFHADDPLVSPTSDIEDSIEAFRRETGRNTTITSSTTRTTNGSGNGTLNGTSHEPPTKRLAQLMLQGWTLTAEMCPREECEGIPLVRNRLRHRHCASCLATYVDPSLAGPSGARSSSSGPAPSSSSPPAPGPSPPPQTTSRDVAHVMGGSPPRLGSTPTRQSQPQPVTPAASAPPSPVSRVSPSPARGLSPSPALVVSGHVRAPFAVPVSTIHPPAPAPVSAPTPIIARPPTTPLVPLAPLTHLLSLRLAHLHSRLLALWGADGTRTLTDAEREEVVGLVREVGEVGRAMSGIGGGGW